MVNKRVLVCVGNGVEETEAIITISVLRKAGMDVVIADCGGTRENEMVTGRERIRIMADTTIEKCCNDNWDVVVLPGGEKLANTCIQNTHLNTLLRRQHEEKKWLAGICTGVLVLQHCKWLHGLRATTSPLLREQIKELKWTDERVCVEKNVITSQAPGTAFEFALRIVEHLDSANRCRTLSDELRVRWSVEETREPTTRG